MINSSRQQNPIKKVAFLLWRLGVVWALFTICRIVFYATNSPSFPHPGLLPFLSGMRFDGASIVFLNAPLIILSLLPHRYTAGRGYRRILNLLYLLPNGLGLLSNLIDAAYYPYSLRRSTAAVFKVATLGDDTRRLLPQFLLDYWYLLLLFVGMLALLYTTCRKTMLTSVSSPPSSPLSQGRGWSVFMVGILVFLLVGRGGIQLRPIDIYHAADTAGTEKMALVLNTPFTIIKTWNRLELEERRYYPEQECKQYFDTYRHYTTRGEYPNKPNVVMLILESFSEEFVGYLSGGTTYTPFLDSLLQHSWTFQYSFANAKKSIEGIPAILSSIPALMDDAFITSSYASNNIPSLARILGNRGYRTSFFHGATNGSMGFDSYSKIAGFETYFGRSEYGDEGDFDGSWGIWDGPFLQRWAQYLNRQQSPFLSVLFTLSSHHPFHIPQAYETRFRDEGHPIHRCIRYTDHSLRLFFNRIEKETWYANTIFVLAADHTFASSDPYYSNPIGQYSIPIAFFKPDGSLQKRDSGLIQQIDILPTLLQLIGYDRPFHAFGQSALLSGNSAIQYRNQTYQIIRPPYALQWDYSGPSALYDISKDRLLQNNILDRQRSQADSIATFLKAFIQTYQNRLIHNNMH